MGLSLYQRAELGVQRQGKESEMTTATRIEELEQMLSKAYAQRTLANNLKANRQLIFAINSNIREWKLELITLREKVGA